MKVVHPTVAEQYNGIFHRHVEATAQPGLSLWSRDLICRIHLCKREGEVGGKTRNCRRSTVLNSEPKASEDDALSAPSPDLGSFKVNIMHKERHTQSLRQSFKNWLLNRQARQKSFCECNSHFSNTELRGQLLKQRQEAQNSICQFLRASSQGTEYLKVVGNWCLSYCIYPT